MIIIIIIIIIIVLIQTSDSWNNFETLFSKASDKVEEGNNNVLSKFLVMIGYYLWRQSKQMRATASLVTEYIPVTCYQWSSWVLILIMLLKVSSGCDSQFTWLFSDISWWQPTVSIWSTLISSSSQRILLCWQYLQNFSNPI